MGLWCWIFGHKKVRKETVQEREDGRFVNYVDECGLCGKWLESGTIFPLHFFDNTELRIGGPDGPRIW
jgi:hypothetical protein